MKFVDMKNHQIFHKIFGDASKPEAVMSFINAVLGFEEEDKITFMRIITPYKRLFTPPDKNIIIDVVAKNKNLLEYNIKIQIADIASFDGRIAFLAPQDAEYIFINILDFNCTNSSEYTSTYRFYDTETNERSIKNIEHHFIELEKFDKTETELTTLIDKWIYFIKNVENLKIIPENLQDKGLENAYLDASKSD